jgi:hypothetical protein
MKTIAKALFVIFSFTLFFSLSFAKVQGKQDQNRVPNTRTNQFQVMSKMEHQLDVAKKATETQDDEGNLKERRILGEDRGLDQKNIEPLSAQIKSAAKRQYNHSSQSLNQTTVKAVVSRNLNSSPMAEEVDDPIARQILSKMDSGVELNESEIAYAKEQNIDHVIPSNPRTPANVSRTALSEGFEGGSIPSNWTIYNNDGDTYEWQAYYTSSAHTGNYVARIHYNSAGNDDWLITPKLSVATGDSIIFWAKSYSSSYLEDFNVKLSATDNAMASFTVTIASVTSTPYDWTRYAYPLESYVGQDVYIAVQCTSVDQWYLYVDDFSGPNIWVDPNPVYAASVSEIDFGNTGTSGVTTNFSVYNNGGSDLTITGISIANTDFTTSVTSLTIASGDTGTIDVTYAPTAVEGDTTDLIIAHNGASSPDTVKLLGAGVDAIFWQDFEAWATNNYYSDPDPVGWSQEASSGAGSSDGKMWEKETDTYSFVYSGSVAAEFDSYEGADGDTGAFITPEIDFSIGSSTDITTASFKFYYKKRGTKAFRVEYSSDQGASWTTGFTTTAENYQSGSGGWDLVTINVPVGSTYIFKFVGEASGSSTTGDVYIDEVSMVEVPPTPSFDLTYSSVTFFPAEIGDIVSDTTFTVGTNTGSGDLIVDSIVVTNSDFMVSLAASIASGDTIFGGGSIDIDYSWIPTTFGWDVSDVIFYTNAATSPDTMQMRGEASRQYVNFDDETFPYGWLIIDNDTVNAYGYDNGWEFYSSYGPGYSVPYVRSHFNVDGANDWMITQKLSVVAGDSIIFYSNSSSSSILEDTIHVYVSTTDNAMSSFTTQIGEVISQGWTNLRTAIDLSTWAGTDIYLAIVHHGSVGTNYWSYRKVDDVMLPARWVDPNPVAALSATAIDFGTTYQNLSLVDVLTIANMGGSDLIISDISTDNSDFTVDVSMASLAPDSALDVTVTFTPTTADTLTGNLIITSNAATSPDTVALTGVGDATSGGPDGFGYTWVNSYDAAGPTFSWIDTSGATSTGIANGDDWRGTVNLPFAFRFYGVPYNQITVTTNGWVGMGPYTNYSSSYWTNYPIPTSSAPNNMIAGLWDDWKAGGSYPAGDILVKTVGTAPNRQFVVIFFEFVRSSSNTDYYTWEVILDEATSDITVQYLDVVGSSDYANNGVGATVGVENADGSDGLEVEYNGSHPIYDGMALFFDAPPPPPTGIEGNVVSVASGLPIEGVTVNVGGFVDSTDAAGDYGIYGVEPGLYDVVFEKVGFNTTHFTISLAAGDTVVVNAALMEDSTTAVSSYVTGFEVGEDQGSTVLISGSNVFAVVDSFVTSGGTIMPSAGAKMLAFPDTSGTYDNNDLAFWVSDSAFDVVGYGSLTLTMDANWATEDSWDYFYIGLVLDDGIMYYDAAASLTGTSTGWETLSFDVSWALSMGTTTVRPAILFDSDGSVVSGWGGAFDEISLDGSTFYLAPPMDLMAESFQPTVNLSWTAPASNGRVNYTLKRLDPNAGNITRPMIQDDSGNLVEAQKGPRDYPTQEVSYSYSSSNRTLTGYNIFRAQWPFGDVELLTFTSGTSYEDATAVDGNYYVYAVTAVYDEGESAESNHADARVGAVTVLTDDLSSEDFEGVAPNLPANWEVFSSSPDHMWMVGDSAAADSAFGAYGNGAPDAHTDFGFINPGYGSDDFEMYLLSPFIDFTDNFTSIVKFAGYAQVWGNYAGYNFVQLWVRANMGPWEMVVDFGYDHNSGWVDYSAPIGSFVSGQDKVQFAFYYSHTGGYNSGGGNGMAIDDFTLETLNGPHDLVLTPTTESIILNWMHPDSTMLNGLSDPVLPIATAQVDAPVPPEDVIVTERTDCFSHGSVNSSWITGFYGPDSGGVVPPTFAALHTFNAGPMTLDEAVIHGYYNTDDTTTARADVFVGVADLNGTTIDTIKRDTVFFDISAPGSWTQATLDLTGLMYNATDSTFLKITWTPLDTGYVALFGAQLWIPGQQIDDPNTVPPNGLSGYDSAGVFTPSGTYNFVIEICGTPTPPALSYNVYKDGNRVVEGLEETTWTDGNVSVVDESCYWVHGVVPMSFNIGPTTIDSMMETDPTNVECATAINLPPNSFDLVSPADGDTIFITPDNLMNNMLFAWTSSVDPNGQEVTFNWTVESSELGTMSLDTTGTAIFIPYEDLVALLSSAGAAVTTATWNVIATDGMDDTPSSNGPRTFTIDITQLGIIGGPAIPEVFALHQNYPNPFNPITTIRYDVPEESMVRVDIYNILGQKVRTLVNSVHQPGYHAVQWNGTNDFGVPVASGMYIYRIQAKDFVAVKKLVLMK